jgi:hypothetical protein
MFKQNMQLDEKPWTDLSTNYHNLKSVFHAEAEYTDLGVTSRTIRTCGS